MYVYFLPDWIIQIHGADHTPHIRFYDFLVGGLRMLVQSVPNTWLIHLREELYFTQF